MRHSNVAVILFLLSGSIIPAVAQQTDMSPAVNKAQPQTTPVQPERTQQQSDQARKPEDRQAEETKMNQNWTTERRDGDRTDIDMMDRMHQRRMGRMTDQDEDRRTVGRNWRRDYDEMDRGSRYGDRSEGRFDERPHRRVKTCIEYENGDEFCRYRD